MRPNILLFNWSQRLIFHNCLWDVNLGLHQMLWVLVPHGLVPLALNGRTLLGQVLAAFVLKRSLSKLSVHFSEPEHHILSCH